MCKHKKVGIRIIESMMCQVCSEVYIYHYPPRVGLWEEGVGEQQYIMIVSIRPSSHMIIFHHYTEVARNIEALNYKREKKHWNNTAMIVVLPTTTRSFFLWYVRSLKVNLLGSTLCVNWWVVQGIATGREGVEFQTAQSNTARADIVCSWMCSSSICH